MLLKSVTIFGFRSIADELVFHVRENVTCLIGANEHGKSNLLEAVQKLSTRKFDAEDRYSHSEDASEPKLTFKLELSEKDRKLLVSYLEKHEATESTKLATLQSANPQDTAAVHQTNRTINLTRLTLNVYRRTDRPQSVDISLLPDGKVRIQFPEMAWVLGAGSDPSPFLNSKVPQVRLFSPSAELVDTITLAELNSRQNLPFEGLLKLAGLWDVRDELFGGELPAQRHLVAGSRRLTLRLRKLWTQGAAHTFRLSETNGNLRITIEDPVTLDSPSRRSLGFRSFLSFALTLYAETDTFTPSDFILLMDEPGMHLHPQGQKDLLKEIRKLGKANQVIYSTHSPFLIDRNDPTSTKLVRKELRGHVRGTRIIDKPYGNNWSSVSQALGMGPSDAFFPPDKALLVEGTSDRLYVARYMGLCAPKTRADLNYLNIIDADRRGEMEGMARILFGSGCELVVLADADQGGDDLSKWLKKVAGSRKQKIYFVNMRKVANKVTAASIEDLLPFDLWVDIVGKYVREILKKDHVIAKDKVVSHMKTMSLGKAMATYLKENGILKRESDFSKTTVADLFCQAELAIPGEDSALFKLCSELTTYLELS